MAVFSRVELVFGITIVSTHNLTLLLINLSEIDVPSDSPGRCRNSTKNPSNSRVSRSAQRVPGRMPVPDCSTVTPDFASSCNNGIDITYLKKNVVNSAASLIEKILVAAAAFERLNQFDLYISQLNESLPDSNVFFHAAIVILGFGPIRPFDKAKGPDTKQRSQQLASCGPDRRQRFRSGRAASAAIRPEAMMANSSSCRSRLSPSKSSCQITSVHWKDHARHHGGSIATREIKPARRFLRVHPRGREEYWKPRFASASSDRTAVWP